ncbi:MAG TPA: hypothetical protein VFS08_08040 [Gemmatimonadaceae bacterium]|nr:hypothetical protein [Gemmatimonadaceae bacterium]
MRPSTLRARRSSLLPALLLAACTTTTTVTYVPSPEQPRLDLVRGQATLERFIGLECDRLRDEGHAAGETQVTVALDDAGLATGAELAATSGDARIDGIIGAVAAQLRLPPRPAGVHAALLRATYRCGDDGSVRATLAPL